MSIKESVYSSLRLKVLLLSSLVSVAVFACLFLATSYWQKKAMLGEVQAGAQRSAKMISKVVEEPMRLGDTEATLLRFEELAKEHKTISVVMTDFAGNVITTDPAEFKKWMAKHPAISHLMKADAASGGGAAGGKGSGSGAAPKFSALKDLPVR